jgi:hypothetical protein
VQALIHDAVLRLEEQLLNENLLAQPPHPATHRTAPCSLSQGRVAARPAPRIIQKGRSSGPKQSGDRRRLGGTDLGFPQRRGRDAPRERQRQERRQRHRPKRQPQRVELRIAIVVGDRAGLILCEPAIGSRLLDDVDGHDVDPLLALRDDRLARGRRDIRVRTADMITFPSCEASRPAPAPMRPSATLKPVSLRVRSSVASITSAPMLAATSPICATTRGERRARDPWAQQREREHRPGQREQALAGLERVEPKDDLQVHRDDEERAYQDELLTDQRREPRAKLRDAQQRRVEQRASRAPVTRQSKSWPLQQSRPTPAPAACLSRMAAAVWPVKAAIRCLAGGARHRAPPASSAAQRARPVRLVRD